MDLVIRPASGGDLPTLVNVYGQCFPREKLHEVWVRANLAAFPRCKYYVAEADGEVVGYACWAVRAGFRDLSVVELEQVGVLPRYAGKGIGKSLLRDSFVMFEGHLEELAVRVKGIYITTREGNVAEALYTKLFGVQRQGLIRNYGSGDEVVLYAEYGSRVLQ